MAKTINAGDDMRRTDTYLVDPFQVIVEENNRGRFTAPPPEHIASLAESILEKGQLQAIVCRKLPDHRLQVVAGFTRTAAARLIREGFTDSNGAFRQDALCKLKVSITDVNEEEAFKLNIIENALRRETSPIDDAHNHKRLREQYGMSQTEIARLYGYKTTNAIARVQKLLMLPTHIQAQVHEGTLSVEAALSLLGLSDEARDAIIEQATTDAGVVSGAAVRTRVRERMLAGASRPADTQRSEGEDTQPASPAPGGSAATAGIKRTIADVRHFLTGVANGRRPDQERQFALMMLDWLHGQATDEALDKAIRCLRLRLPEKEDTAQAA